jgi:hypothetical protein
MRARIIALGLSGALAAAPAAVLVSPAGAATTHAKAGATCKPTKTAPKGFVCKKNSKGKFVLAKKKSTSKKKGTSTTKTGTKTG